MRSLDIPIAYLFTLFFLSPSRQKQPFCPRHRCWFEWQLMLAKPHWRIAIMRHRAIKCVHTRCTVIKYRLIDGDEGKRKRRMSRIRDKMRKKKSSRREEPKKNNAGGKREVCATSICEKGMENLKRNTLEREEMKVYRKEEHWLKKTERLCRIIGWGFWRLCVIRV